MNETPRNFRWIGQNLKRPEDLRLLTGRGNYVDDVKLARMVHAAVLPSPHAHARIVSVDLEAARQMPATTSLALIHI